jgi:hypothetical protein
MQKELHFKTLVFSIVLSFFFQLSFGQSNNQNSLTTKYPFACAVNPCLNGGLCTELTSTYSCECTEFYFGSDCQFLKSLTLVAPSAPVVFKNDVNVPLDDAIQATGFSGGTYNVTAGGLSNMTITFTITGGTLTLGTTDVVFGGGGNGSSSFTATGQAETVAFEDGALNIALNQATFTPTPNLFGTNVANITFTAVYGPDYKGNGPNYSDSPATVTFDIQESTLSINNLNFERNIKVYPVPAKEFVQISNNTIDIISKIEIIDMLGNIVSTINFSGFNSNIKIDVSAFNSGIYFIKISKKDYTINRKIILN